MGLKEKLKRIGFVFALSALPYLPGCPNSNLVKTAETGKQCLAEQGENVNNLQKISDGGGVSFQLFKTKEQLAREERIQRTINSYLDGEAMFCGNLLEKLTGRNDARRDNLEINPDKVLEYRFGRFTYTISMNELADFLANKSIYGGDIAVLTLETDWKGYEKKSARNGYWVARKGEPSLTRLTQAIIGDIKDKREQAQQLLTFVNKNIKYAQDEASKDKDIMKRPNEILMSKRADCSGKSVLYASLLEQTEINYRIVYFHRHVLVAVEGDFTENKCRREYLRDYLKSKVVFEWKGREYTLADPTVDDFTIGATAHSNLDPIMIKYVEKPGGAMYNLTGRKLDPADSEAGLLYVKPLSDCHEE